VQYISEPPCEKGDALVGALVCAGLIFPDKLKGFDAAFA
jgi:hypothetical protein